MTDTDGMSDQEIIARTLYGEASNQGCVGQQAVCNVIMNRSSIGGWWGSTPKEVCLKPYQFSCWNGTNETNTDRARLMAATTNDPIYNQCYRIAGLAIQGQLPDITLDSDSYKVVGTYAKWTTGLTPVITIGQHEFYKTV